jgi:uncharacterized membrane protein YeaQ/YmgE (transglycosylase-associated protein family)
LTAVTGIVVSSKAEKNSKPALGLRLKRRATMLGILGWIVFGLIVGALAKLVMPGRDPGGIFVTIALGIAGALVAGFIGRALGWYQPGEPAGFLMATLGAVVLLLVYRQVAVRA